jgi:hypothetical protein
VITPDQASKLQEADKLRDEVIKVDAFKDLNPCSTPAKARSKAKAKTRARKTTE